MSRPTRLPAALSLLALLGPALACCAAPVGPKAPAAAELKDSGVAGGIVIDKQNDSITVQVDGLAEPTKFAIGQGMDRHVVDVLKTVFTVDRVNVRYRTEGDARRLLSVEKLPGRQSGVVIGEVLKVYNDFWVAVKPKEGPIEGFALNGPAEKVKAAADVLKSLKPGDQVAIQYSTDFERHRILKVESKPAPAKK